MTFESLGLIPALVQAVREQGYTTPTAIQTEAIPAALQGRDVLGAAQTGSGKTAAFALPLLQRLAPALPGVRRRTQTLVLVPTRELASQVGEWLVELSRHLTHRPRIAVVFGGASINPQMMALRGGAEVVVATPGRLLDLVDHNALRLDTVGTLVLDEADRLLDLGFADELAEVLALLPAKRQNLFFSATFPAAVQTLADGLLNDPVRIALSQADARAQSNAAGGVGHVGGEGQRLGDGSGEGADAPDISQRAIEVDVPRRTALLRHLIATYGWDQVLVFVATRYATEHVADKLARAGIEAASLHGEMSQGARRAALSAFALKRVPVLICTDLAARGIDIPKLPVVVNYDLPRSTEDYTHRIGRTGRAGASGLAVSFVSASTEAHFRLIEKRQQLRVPREQIPGFEPTEVATPEQGAGGIKGKRPSKKDKLRAAAAEAVAATSPFKGAAPSAARPARPKRRS